MGSKSTKSLLCEAIHIHIKPPRSHIPRSVISANVRLALRWRSIFSENTSVLRARSGSPEKKSVSPRWVAVSSPFAVKIRFISTRHLHSRGIAADRRQPLARYRPEPARTVHHGTCLVTFSICHVRRVPCMFAHTATTRLASTHVYGLGLEIQSIFSKTTVGQMGCSRVIWPSSKVDR